MALCLLLNNVLVTASTAATLESRNVSKIGDALVSFVVIIRLVQIVWNYVENIAGGKKYWSQSFVTFIISADFITWSALWVGTMSASVTLIFVLRRHMDNIATRGIDINESKFVAAFRRLYLLMLGYTIAYSICVIDFIRQLHCRDVPKEWNCPDGYPLEILFLSSAKAFADWSILLFHTKEVT
eukprot:795351_1